MAAAPSKSSSGSAAGITPRLLRLMREAMWLASLALGVCLALALLTHEVGDPGWSRAASGGALQNGAGLVGAWLSDILYYIFGRSALWLLAAVAIGLVRSYGLLMRDRQVDRLSAGVMLAGLLLLLVGSAAFEALRFQAFAGGLPAGAGGALGSTLAGLSAGLLGITGATLLLLVLSMAGLSLLSGISWLELAEHTGAAAEPEQLARA
ncbi:MAG: DNA translocase FtsK 4TM domain-containing protein [Burkholderiales bacterium]